VPIACGELDVFEFGGRLHGWFILHVFFFFFSEGNFQKKLNPENEKVGNIILVVSLRT